MVRITDADFCYLTIELIDAINIYEGERPNRTDAPKLLQQDTPLRLLPKKQLYTSDSHHGTQTHAPQPEIACLMYWQQWHTYNIRY